MAQTRPLDQPADESARRSHGYWVVDSLGHVFALGDARWLGNPDPIHLVAGESVTGFGDGYLMVGPDGGIFNFSDQPFRGSLGNDPPAHPVVSIAALDS